MEQFFVTVTMQMNDPILYSVPFAGVGGVGILVGSWRQFDAHRNLAGNMKWCKPWEEGDSEPSLLTYSSTKAIFNFFHEDSCPSTSCFCLASILSNAYPLRGIGDTTEAAEQIFECDTSRRGKMDFLMTWTAPFDLDLLKRGSHMIETASSSKALPSASLNAVATSVWLLSNLEVA